VGGSDLVAARERARLRDTKKIAALMAAVAPIPPDFFPARNSGYPRTLLFPTADKMEAKMGFGRGILLWLLGIPIPIIILLALFWHS
jgi:hypothetical protein